MFKKTFFIASLAYSVILFSTSLFAQVQVEDRQLSSPRQEASNSTSSNTSGSSGGINAAELYYQMQVLQQEVQQLRGMVEEQGFQLKRLKQQRMDDYLDLDRRLGKLGGGVSASTTRDRSPVTDASNASGSYSSPTPTAMLNRGSADDEAKSYKAAVSLVLKERKYDEAVTALNKHLENYPSGRHAANAQYWLGEIYIKKDNMEVARDWFTRLIGEFPDHRKVPDAKFKLAKIYDLLGDKVNAQRLLQEVATSNNSASKLAEEYLLNNF